MVLLTHAYFLHEDAREQLIMKPYPPLGILYLAAWLDRHGADNVVFDSTFSTFRQLQTELLLQRPRIIALYANLMTKINAVRLMRWIRAQPELEHSTIVLGGPDVSHNALNYLHAGAHLMVIGEGEQTLLEIARLPRQAPEYWSQVTGTAFLDTDGQLVQTPARVKLRDLDELPVPARHKIDLRLYLDAWKKTHGHSAISISTQRGCPYTCKWCSTAVYGQSYRRRSPAAVAYEIEQLTAQYDFDLIWFVDDVFTVSHKWLAAFRDELRHRRLNVRFECITRADRMTPEVVAMLREAGCFRVWIGAESGAQRIIDAMDRRVQVEQVQEMIIASRQAGIETGTFIMLGYPGETEADILATARHLKTANPDWFTITLAYPIKGTALYNEVENAIQTPGPWESHTDREIDFPRTYSRRYYNYAIRWMVNTVHFHKEKMRGEAFSPSAIRYRIKALAARTGMWATRKWH